MKNIFLLSAIILFSVNCFSQFDSSQAALYKKYAKTGSTQRIVGTSLISAGALSVIISGVIYAVTGFSNAVVTAVVGNNPDNIDHSLEKTLLIGGLAGIGTGTILIIEGNKKRKKVGKLIFIQSTFKIVNYKTFFAPDIPSVGISLSF